MKKFSTLFIAALLLAGWSSGCADYLNTVPVDKSSPNTFLKGVEQAKSMLAGIYYCFYDDSPAYITPYTYENMCDNSYNHHTWEFSAEFASGTQTAASWWAELKWTKDWQAISRANSLIRSMALATGIGPADSRKILAEARFLRAWFYFDLVRFYGRVPLVDENSPQENAPREELDKVMAFIKGDVEYAVGNLDNIPGGEVASLGSALMLRLQIAQYEYDNAEVIACAKAIKELGYDLYGDFRKLFLDEGINDPSNKEVIFKVNYAEDLRSSYMTQLWYNWFSFNTTLEAVNSFFTANGLPVKPLEADNGASIPADPAYDKDYPFENRDPRLKLSVLCPGDEYRCDGTSRYQVHWQPANWDNKTGFAAKKGANETLENLNNDGGDKILMRYGEVLLAWAEAENEENGPKGAYEMIDRLRRRVLELNRDAARWYYDLLCSPEGAAVQAYLDKRQIRRGIAVRFGMGASLDQWDALLRAMTDKGFTKQELLASGLVVNGKNGGLYDKFRNRLMLPVIDVRGDVVGFGSRVIDKSEPKYMNTTETVAYSKRRVLYGLNLAKKTKRPNMILCEGNLDVVTLHQAGFDNAVACMGTALTQEQIRLLSRFTRELVLCYDNDGAGQMATDRALELLQNSEFTVKVLRLPQRLVDGHYVKQDADDFIKYQGRDAFEQLLSGSANGIEFTMSEIAAKYDLKDDKGRIAYAGEIAETLCKLNDPVEREVYTTRAAEAASLPAEAMRMEVQRAAKRMQAKARKAQERQEMNPISALQPADRSIRYQNVRSALAEEGVIRLLMQDESLFPPEMPVRPEEFSSPLLGRIYGELWQRRGHASMAALAAVLTPEEMNHLTALLQKPESAANAPQALADYIRIIREEHTKRTGGTDPLAAAMETYKDKKGYGGKRT